MIWIVSKTVCKSQRELECRHKYIKDVTNARVSHWTEFECEIKRFGKITTKFNYYMCKSDKGEYGIVITAHIGEVAAIINSVIEKKRAIVVINSCKLEKDTSKKFLDVVMTKNGQSELFFAQQEANDRGYLVNYADNVGEFGFSTTLSERELFRYRHEGFIKSIRKSFEKVVTS